MTAATNMTTTTHPWNLYDYLECSVWCQRIPLVGQLLARHEGGSSAKNKFESKKLNTLEMEKSEISIAISWYHLCWISSTKNVTIGTHKTTNKVQLKLIAHVQWQNLRLASPAENRKPKQSHPRDSCYHKVESREKFRSEIFESFVSTIPLLISSADIHLIAVECVKRKRFKSFELD